jgi:hypothetical protein
VVESIGWNITHSDSPANACSHQWQHRAQSDCTCLSFPALVLHAYTRLLGSSVKTRTLLYPCPNQSTWAQNPRDKATCLWQARWPRIPSHISLWYPYFGGEGRKIKSLRTVWDIYIYIYIYIYMYVYIHIYTYIYIKNSQLKNLTSIPATHIQSQMYLNNI